MSDRMGVEVLNERIGRLERSNRLLRFGVGVAVASAVLIAIMGQRNPSPRLEARELVILSAQGDTVARIGDSDHGMSRGISIYGAKRGQALPSTSRLYGAAILSVNDETDVSLMLEGHSSESSTGATSLVSATVDKARVILWNPSFATKELTP